MMFILNTKNITQLINLLLLSAFIFPALAQTDVSIEKLTVLIDKDANNAQLYINRGDAYFEKREFFDAVEDYTAAIELDPKADQAYFGRGMALARQGMISEGITDLSVFIKRNPKSSLAYTKRGVRYMWLQDFDNAKKDLIKALELDAKNAEAHDDLGVIYAKSKNYEKAIEHFSATIRIDPSYQKGYHNLAMTLFLVEEDAGALLMVNQALALNSNHRDALLLKGLILEKLGRYEEATTAKEDAEFLPETNWSESVPVQ
jgi:tetratricopeptide (TPR) repeat protein